MNIDLLVIMGHIYIAQYSVLTMNRIHIIRVLVKKK